MTPKQIDADAIETEKDGSKCAPIKNDPPEKKHGSFESQFIQMSFSFFKGENV